MISLTLVILCINSLWDFFSDLLCVLNETYFCGETIMEYQKKQKEITKYKMQVIFTLLG